MTQQVFNTRFIVVTLAKLDLMSLYKETHELQRQIEPECDAVAVNVSGQQELHK